MENNNPFATNNYIEPVIETAVIDSAKRPNENNFYHTAFPQLYIAGYGYSDVAVAPRYIRSQLSQPQNLIINKISTGQYQVIHNLGNLANFPIVTLSINSTVGVTNVTANSFEVSMSADYDFSFIIMATP